MALDRIRRLRLQGHYRTALRELNAELKTQPAAPACLAEVVKLFLLTDRKAAAGRAFACLRRHPDAPRYYETEYLLRLHLATGTPPLQANEIDTLDATTSWCQVYKHRRVDPLYPVAIEHVVFACAHGPINYRVGVRCPSCDHRYEVHLRRTLLFYAEGLCPRCFGRQLFNSDAIQAHLRARFDRPTLWPIDQAVHALQRDLNRPDGPHLPRLGRYLNQDYMFWLTEVLINRIAER